MSQPGEFIETFFPLILHVGPQRYDDEQLQAMWDGWARYFERGQRYALVSLTRRDAESPPARVRKAMADWASSPAVREKSKALCVASATVVSSAMARGALTALMWLWKPAMPHSAVGTVAEALAFCLPRLEAAGLMTEDAAALRAKVLERLRDL
jgi:hypothetical protein